MTRPMYLTSTKNPTTGNARWSASTSAHANCSAIHESHPDEGRRANGDEGRVHREDYEYKREGTCSVLLCFEPLRAWRHIEVRAHRGKRNFAETMCYLAEKVYPDAETIRIVLDNMNTQRTGKRSYAGGFLQALRR